MSTEKKFVSGPVSVADLTIHPILQDAPHLAKKDPRYLAMKASWEESGVVPTILITPSGEIVDGRHRYWFAKEQGAQEIDAKVIDPTQVPSIIVGALSGRNHGTKSQIAYLSAPALQAAFEQARARRELIQKSGGRAKLPPVESAEDLAERLGINETYLKQAQRIHEAFANETKFDFNNPPAAAVGLLFDTPEEIAEYQTPGGRKKRSLTLRAYLEPRILAAENPLSLGDCLKAIGYFINGGPEKSAGQPPKRNSHLHVLDSGWKTLAKAAPRWEKLSAVDREEAEKSLAKALAKFPRGLLVILGATLRSTLSKASPENLPAGPDEG